jgi:hypothetical protein
MKLEILMKLSKDLAYLERLPRSLLYKYRGVPFIDHDCVVQEMIARAKKRGIRLSEEDAGKRLRQAIH